MTLTYLTTLFHFNESAVSQFLTPELTVSENKFCSFLIIVLERYTICDNFFSSQIEASASHLMGHFLKDTEGSVSKVRPVKEPLARAFHSYPVQPSLAIKVTVWKEHSPLSGNQNMSPPPSAS